MCFLSPGGSVRGPRAGPRGRIARRPGRWWRPPPAAPAPPPPAAARAASGCLLLPGLPYLGIEHRAAWVEAASDGTVTKLVSSVDVHTSDDPDLAVMAALLAA